MTTEKPNTRGRRGAGNITKIGTGKKARWKARYSPPTPAGEARRQVVKTFDREKDATGWLIAQGATKQHSEFVLPMKQTVGAYLDDWLPSVRSKVRPSTLRSYQNNVAHLKPFLGTKHLQDLDRVQVKAAYATLEQGTDERRPLAPKSVHNVHLTLHRALQDAVDDRKLVTNPAERAHGAPRNRAEMKTWSPAELRTFLEAVQGERDAALWRLAALTGKARGELLGLRWRQVDLDDGTLTITKARVRLGHDGYGDSEPKTARGRRTIDLDAATVRALRRWQVAQKAERLAVGAAWPDRDCVFTRPDGQPLDGDVVSQRFGRLAKRAGLPRIRFHDLRHTAATLLLASGTPAHVVSRRLGHSNEGFTLSQYTHVLPGQQQEAVDRLAAMIDG